MKNNFLLYPALLLVLPAAQATDYPEVCTPLFDEFGNDYTECVPVISETSASYNMTGTMNAYIDGELLISGLAITGVLTTSVWHDDWFTGEEGVSSTLKIGSTIAFDSYTVSMGTITPPFDLSYDFFNEEMLDLYGSPFIISSDTLWDITMTPGAVSMRTLDGDGNGFAGIEAAVSYLPPNTVIEIQLNAVPVPAAIWLFGSGLLGLLGMTYKRKQLV